ncbi:hypothetical protein ACR79M_14930 [Sphingobacterium spiritivorum]|uniref:hypothetical protein n=1 Tax=Sphingobacterium spiritivorum TaxID=258 RepID=UPI003DA21989
MDKLKLEHLAPYLAYGLKLMYNDGSIRGLLHLDVSGVSSVFKPILRPLSDLTKEIEHTGERFIPIIYLYNISNGHNFNKELNFEWVKSWGAGNILRVNKATTGEYIEFIYYDLEFRKEIRLEKGSYRYGMYLPHAICCESKIENQYKLHRLLFEWHFDVFGLIEKGLAIDINTLESEDNNGD